MSIVCHETGATLLNDYNRIYNATYKVSAVKRENGRLFISDQEHTIGEDRYRCIIANLRNNVEDIPEDLFFAVNDKEGYDGAGISPDLFKPKGYQFLQHSDAKQFLPNCFRDLTSRLDSMEWLDFEKKYEVVLPDNPA